MPTTDTRPTLPTPPPSPPAPDVATLAELVGRANLVHAGLTASDAHLHAVTAYSHLLAGRHDQARAALDQLDRAALGRATHAADLLAVYADHCYAGRAIAAPADLAGLAAREAAA